MNDVRLIDANALDVIRFTPTGGELLDATERGWNECISFLQTEAKTIDAVPVVHGRWKRLVVDRRHQIEADECTACGFVYGGLGIEYFRYCPNCGAKMDGVMADG